MLIVGVDGLNGEDWVDVVGAGCDAPKLKPLLPLFTEVKLLKELVVGRAVVRVVIGLFKLFPNIPELVVAPALLPKILGLTAELVSLLVLVLKLPKRPFPLDLLPVLPNKVVLLLEFPKTEGLLSVFPPNMVLDLEPPNTEVVAFSLLPNKDVVFGFSLLNIDFWSELFDSLTKLNRPPPVPVDLALSVSALI